MAYTIESDQSRSESDNSKAEVEKQTASKPPSFSPEMVSALTPICLALIGGVIGMAVLIRGGSDAGFGLASTAIAGAAGLAQPQKEQSQTNE